MEKKFDSLRNEYMKKKLSKKDVHPDPFKQFVKWMDEAIKAGVYEPTAMSLATTGKNLLPSNRIVLLKEIMDQGFVFFTNYESKKGHQLAENPYGSILFFWPELEKQIRIEGRIEKTPREISDNYYLTRPAKRRIGAWASPQSREIPHRDHLEKLQADYEKKFAHHPPHRPENWGGFMLIPYTFEFWQGRPNRLHDRIEYYFDDNDWKIRRLAP
ncbi:MAG: pyridoxamine 5'-phosphate oxidase [Bacteroidales bacterium]|jgi:pyridoxamine 5'-phosphate oxidase|nr:pyridoxamine 5'-phosphate oxidase [Bacteroidales bacterium]